MTSALQKHVDSRRISAKSPHLQLHDSKVVCFWEAAVIEGEAGAAAAQVQILIHPQPKVTTSSPNGKRVQVAFYEKGVFPGPSETLKSGMQHEEEGFPCAIEGFTWS